MSHIGEPPLEWLQRPAADEDGRRVGVGAVIQFGGESQHELVSRLSTQGCNANELTIGDIHYSYEHTNDQNQAFAEVYPHSDRREV